MAKTPKTSSAGSRKKRRHRAPLLAADVIVITKKVTGTDVQCDFEGAIVSNNAIFVSYMLDTDITFELVDKTGLIEFDTNNPFGNQNNRCPKTKASPKPPCSVGSPRPAANRFTMRVDQTGRKAVTYYRLNFTNGLSCDPIIIHE